MRIHNIQSRQNIDGKQQLIVSQVMANNLEEAKSQVIAQEGLRASQVLKDEAIL